MSDDKKKKAPAITEETKPAEKASKKEAKTAEPEKVYVTSTELAKTCGTKGTILRRWLRTLPRFQDSGYTRYKWDPADPDDAKFLANAKEDFHKHQLKAEEKRQAKADEDAKKKAEKESESGDAVPKKTKKGKKTPEPEPEPEETEDAEEVFEDEDEEDGEEIE